MLATAGAPCHCPRRSTRAELPPPTWTVLSRTVKKPKVSGSLAPGAYSCSSIPCTTVSSCDCESVEKRPDLWSVACKSPCCKRIGLSSLPNTWRRVPRFTRRSSLRCVTSTVMLKGSLQRSTRSQMQLRGPRRHPSLCVPSPPATTRSSPDLTKKTHPVSLPRFAGHSPTSKTWDLEASLMASSCRAERPSSMLTESRKARLSLTCCMMEACTTRLKRRPSAAQTPTPDCMATTETLLGRRCRRANSPKARPLGIWPTEPPLRTTSRPSVSATKKLVPTMPSLTTNSPASYT
mmetsp:Transcript_122002/g.340123  ORF Transcript_122002/g.340123 Transcript_122002/m.340123 type:complete len:292 (+) Transcript_122002:201-1076(+)